MQEKHLKLALRIARPFLIFAVLCPVALMIANYVTPFDPAWSNTDRYERRTYLTLSYPFAVPYLLLTPRDYDPEKKYPLVLVFHGANKHSYASEVLGSWDLKEKYPAFILMPIAPFHRPWGLPKGDEFKNPRVTALDLAMDILTHVQKEYSIDPTRIYVTGASVGGFGTIAAIINYPDVFAAAVSVCGGWATGDAGRIPKDVPLRLYHGTADHSIPVRYSRNLAEALKDRGANVYYKEYPGVDHNSWDYAYKEDELWAWLFAQRRWE